MFWGHYYITWGFRRLNRARISIVFLCFSLMMFSINTVPKGCKAFAVEKNHNHKSHFHGVSAVMNDSYVPRIPFENPCSCASPMGLCCVGAMNNTPKISHHSLVYRDSTPQLPFLLANLIKPFNYMPSSQRDRTFRYFNSFHPYRCFLINCAFLI